MILQNKPIGYHLVITLVSLSLKYPPTTSYHINVIVLLGILPIKMEAEKRCNGYNFIVNNSYLLDRLRTCFYPNSFIR